MGWVYRALRRRLDVPAVPKDEQGLDAGVNTGLYRG